MAQRLVRSLCPDCKVPVKISPEECHELGLSVEHAGTQIYGPSEHGCKNCSFNSYKGRCGIHEILELDDEVRSLIMQRTNASKLRSAAHKLKSLRYDGSEKVLSGATSVQEVLRVTQEDTIELNE